MIRIYLSNKHGSSHVDHASGALVLGRDRPAGPGSYAIHDGYVSRDQLRIEELPGNRVRLENLSRKVPVRCVDGTTMAPGASWEMPLPANLSAGTTQIHLAAGSADAFGALSLRTIAPPAAQSLIRARDLSATINTGPSASQLILWFETLVSVQRAAACSAAFYEEIARAVVQLIGLDSGLFLQREGEGWRAIAGYAPGETPPRHFSRTVLDKVAAEGRTFYEDSDPTSGLNSLAGVSAVVAAPVFGEDGQTVIGAVYGSRGGHEDPSGPGIRPLHAQLVQVLAAAATAGIARMGSEAEAARRHVQFEQFFSRELAGELDRDPDLLAGRDREVTVLVSDVRSYSSISERIGPRETCELISDVLDRLTAQIQDAGGVVVDYSGDGIMAMWNAPVEQPDHAALACRAALAMVGELPTLNAQWSERLGGPIALGIGINTGAALVGNVGSKQRLKYGPLGHAVNLASRVEGATKQLGVPILITGDTRARLPGSFATRRLCRVRVVGIDAPVDLHELHGEAPDPDWSDRRTAYEAALSLFEQARLSESQETLAPLLERADEQPDRPSLTLADRIADALRASEGAPDPVLSLDRK